MWSIPYFSGLLLSNRQVTIPIPGGGVQLTRGGGTASKGGVRLAKGGYE